MDATIDGHRALIERACSEFPDGWALSMSSVDIAKLAPLLPPDTRWAAWVKPFASFKPNVNPAYAWEPVAFRGGRKRGRKDATIRDYVSEPIALRKGLPGAKPPTFCAWILDLLGFDPTDEFLDAFPGTGAMGAVIAARREAANGSPLVLI